MSLFPAIMIGGPPHSGKSVLAYSLTRTLRTEGVPHYLLRAYPDGEGDWANEADPTLVRQLRIKGYGDTHWIKSICRDIDRRQLPLLVDVGGNPTSAQAEIFSHCTHSILLTPSVTAQTKWRAITHRAGLIPLAELHSTLHGKNIVHQTSPILRGKISGLERGTSATGKTFSALIEILRPLMMYSPGELRAMHIAAAPTETVIDLHRLANTLTDDNRWHPRHLLALMHYLPDRASLAIYGRAPGWLYAAIARHSFPAPFFQFDARLGWVTPPTLRFGAPAQNAPLRVSRQQQNNAIQLNFTISANYLDIADAFTLCVPPLPPDTGIILNGKLPHWLITALVRRYAPAPWLAVFQPQLNGAVVIHTQNNTPALGAIVSKE